MSAQRYKSPQARERMSRGMCPECGQAVSTHLDSPSFWLPRGCDLTTAGVTERIAQHESDGAA